MNDNNSDSVLKKLGENITKQRQKVGMTRKDLSNKLGVSENAISTYERGMREPSLDKIKQLAKIFNCSIIDLVEENPIAAKADIVFDYRLKKAKEILNQIGYKLVDSDTAKEYHRHAGFDDEPTVFDDKEKFFIVSASDEKSNPLIMENANHFVSTIEKMIDLAAEPFIRKSFRLIFEVS